MLLTRTARDQLKLVYYYDLLCPHSYLGYQMLKQKLPAWQKKKDFDVDYVPVLGPKIFRCSHGSLYDGVNSAKRNYTTKELDLVADLYQLKKPAMFYWGCDLLEKRSVSALMLLAHLRREEPQLYLKFLDSFFDKIWLEKENVDRVTKFFKIGREMGMELREMDELISRIESTENVNDLLCRTSELILRDALGTPWIVFGTASHCIEMNEIMRLEMIDHFLDYPEHLPQKRPIPEGKRPYYPSPKSTFFEDYSC